MNALRDIRFRALLLALVPLTMVAAFIRLPGASLPRV